jgi:uncharacterized membrane protein
MATRLDPRAVEAARQDEMHAKRPVTNVAGPYGHPLHPIFVTIPIGAWVGSLVLDIASKSADNGGALARGAYWMIGVGVVGALVAALFGFLDFLAVPRRTRALKVALTHMLLNLTVVALFVASFIWRADRGATKETSTGLFVLSGVALALLLVSGWLGGKLAYHYGVRVADEDTQLEGYLHNGDRARSGTAMQGSRAR